MPVEWATTQMNLANAYRNRIRGDKAENIERAIEGYGQALQVMTRQAMPVEWATTQMNLANAYSDRIRGDKADELSAWDSIKQSISTLPDAGSPAQPGSTERPDGLESFEPAPAEGSSPLATVTRYTDIACPRRVWVEAERLTVVVQLTVNQPTRSAARAALDVRPDAPVAIRLTAPAFDALNALDQTTAILPDADSPPVVFHLKPRVAGPAQLVFDFRQGGNPVGAAVVNIDVTPDQVATTQTTRGVFPVVMPQGIDAPDLLLYIHYDASAGIPRLRFTLDETQHGLSTTFDAVDLHSDPAHYAADLYRTLSELAQAAGGRAGDAALQDALADEVRRLGYKLWRLLIPSGLKELYLANRAAWQGKTLLVVSDEPHLPWELVWPHDPATRARDDAPWSVSLRLLRWLRRDAVSRGYAGPAAVLPFQVVACVAPTHTGLSLLETERGFVLGLLAGRAGRDASPSSTGRRALLALLRAGGYDWLHVVTHGSAPGGEYPAGAIELDDGVLLPDDLFDPEMEAHIGAVHPGFVLNLCHGGRQVWGLTHLGGWANALVSAGAGLVAAPLWEVTDSQALAFAQAFYTRLLAGAPVAAAVHAARLAARNGDPTWLAYSVYAHPNARVQAGCK
jgi:SAM-dependent methyltransferase